MRRLTMNRIKKRHEEKVCKCALKYLNQSYQILSSPDQDERNSKAVDYYGVIDERFFYLEHTLIESYPNQIADNEQTKFLSILKKELLGALPLTGKFNLSISPFALKGFKDNKKIIKELKKWIKQNSHLLKVASPSKGPRHFIRETPIELGFEVTLALFPTINPDNLGKLNIVCYEIDELESKRVKRISKAIESKCPKLLGSKRNNNDLTFLVLESNDMELANFVDVGNALKMVLDNYKKQIPDQIVLVETDDSPWNVFKFDGRYFNLLERK